MNKQTKKMIFDKGKLTSWLTPEGFYVIKWIYRDEHDRRCTQFVAEFRSAGLDNKAAAQEFIDGIEAIKKE